MSATEAEVPQRFLKTEILSDPHHMAQIPSHDTIRRAGESSGFCAETKTKSPPAELRQLSSLSTTMMKPENDSVTLSDQIVFDIGVGFINKLVQRTLQNLSLQDSVPLVHAPPKVIEDLFYKPAPSRLGDSELPQELLSYHQLRSLTGIAMNHVHLLSSIVSNAQLTEILRRVHNTAGWSTSLQQSDDLILLRMVVALGYLHDTGVHLEFGCLHARTER